MKTQVFFAALLPMLPASACATSRPISSISPAHAQAQAPLLAFQTKLTAEKGSPEELGCTLHLTPVDPSGPEYRLDLTLGEQTFFLPLPAGK